MEVRNVQRNEIVITRSDIILHGMNGSGFVIGRKHYETIRKAITISNRIKKANKHNVIQIDLDSWNE